MNISTDILECGELDFSLVFETNHNVKTSCCCRYLRF